MIINHWSVFETIILVMENTFIKATTCSFLNDINILLYTYMYVRKSARTCMQICCAHAA